jgi:hypothetical protein
MRSHISSRLSSLLARAIRAPAIAIGAAFSILAGATCDRRPSPNDDREQAVMATAQQESLRSVYFGRFRADVPRTAVPKSHHFTLRGVSIDEEPLSATEEEYAERWKAHVDSVRRLEDLDTGRRSAILNDGELFPGVRALVYHDAQFGPPFVQVDAVLRADGRATWFRVGARRSVEDLRQQIRELVDARAPRDPVNNATTRGAFYTEWSVFRLTPGPNERALLSLTDHGSSIDIEFETQSVGRVDERGLLGRVDDLMRDWASEAPLETDRSGVREVAGLKGEEVIGRVTNDKHQRTFFKWEYRGTARSATAPSFSIEMEAKNTSRASATSLWEAILSSVRPN